MQATKTRRAGRSTRAMAAERHRSAVRTALLASAVCMVIALLIFRLPLAKAGWWGVAGALVLLFIAKTTAKRLEKRATLIMRSEQRAIRGAVAEERIEDLLDELGDGYYVLHDLANPNGNIDHVVIGREAGLFLIETKSHRGRVETRDGALLVNGHPPEKDFIAQTLRNTYWLRERVQQLTGATPWVTPIIVFTNAFVTAGPPIKGVCVLNKKYLLAAIRSETRPGPWCAALWEKRRELDAA